MGRFWGCSHNLTAEPAVVLSGLNEAAAEGVRSKAKEATKACAEWKKDILWKSTNKTGKESTGFIWDGDKGIPTTCHEIWSMERLSNKLSVDEAVAVS